MGTVCWCAELVLVTHTSVQADRKRGGDRGRSAGNNDPRRPVVDDMEWSSCDTGMADDRIGSTRRHSSCMYGRKKRAANRHSSETRRRRCVDS